MIDRRGFVLTVTGALLARPRLVAAQRTVRTPRIGVLAWEGCPGADSPFGRALGDLGYRWGEILCGSGEGDYGRLQAAGALARTSMPSPPSHTSPLLLRTERRVRSRSS